MPNKHIRRCSLIIFLLIVVLLCINILVPKKVYAAEDGVNPTSVTGIAYVDWAIEIANNHNEVGYSQPHRQYTNNAGSCRDVDCSSFVYFSLINGGYPQLAQMTSYPFTTFNMTGYLEQLGFYKVNLEDLQPGDILVDVDRHTEIYIGNNQTAAAHSNKDGRCGSYGNPDEVSVANMWTKNYDYAMRSDDVPRTGGNAQSLRALCHSVNKNYVEKYAEKNQNMAVKWIVPTDKERSEAINETKRMRAGNMMYTYIMAAVYDKRSREYQEEQNTVSSPDTEKVQKEKAGQETARQKAKEAQEKNKKSTSDTAKKTSSGGSLKSRLGKMAALSDRVQKLMDAFKETEMYKILNDDLSNLIWKMMSDYDDDAANSLVKEYLGDGNMEAGIDAVNDFLRSRGYDNTVMGRPLSGSHSIYLNAESYTTAGDCAEFLLDAYHKRLFTEEYSTQFMYMMEHHQEGGNKIPEGALSGEDDETKKQKSSAILNFAGSVNSKKYGYTETDAAIMYGAKNDCILVVLTDKLDGHNDEAVKDIQNIASETYKTLCKRTERTDMTITAIDYTQDFGDSCYLESNGKGILMDVYLQKSATENWLDQNGKTNFDVYVSHYHGDHCAYMSSIIRNEKYNIGKVYLPDPTYLKLAYDSGESYPRQFYGFYNDIVDAANERGVEIVYLHKDDTFMVGGMKFEVLWGADYRQGAYDTHYINNNSLITRVTCDGIRYLTCGDIEEETENIALAAGIDLDADIYKSSHHGGSTSNTNKFIKAVNPSWAFWNFCGDSPRSFGSGWASRTRKYLEAQGVNSLSVRYNGTITFTVHNGKIRVSAERNTAIDTVNIGGKDVAFTHSDKSPLKVTDKMRMQEILNPDTEGAFFPPGDNALWDSGTDTDLPYDVTTMRGMDFINAMLEYAKYWEGKITYGSSQNGTDPSGLRFKRLRNGGVTDCSWFVYHVLYKFGLVGEDFIHSYEWGNNPSCYPGAVNIGNDISKASPGDIICTGAGSRPQNSHVAMYLGNGMQVECGYGGSVNGVVVSHVPSNIRQIVHFTCLNPNIASTSVPEITGDGSTTVPTTTIGGVYTYENWDRSDWARGTAQRRLWEGYGNFDAEGFGKIGDRYVVACTTTFGKVGDRIDFYLDNGLIIKTVMGDAKSQKDAGCTRYGHLGGRCVIEFMVKKSQWYNKGHANPGNASCHPEWGGAHVVKAINYGSIWSN